MKILVIQQKMIGDVLTSSILFKSLRKKYPKAQLDYLINENTFPVVDNNPFIDNYIFFTKKEQSSKIELIKLAYKVKSLDYDIVIDVYSKLSSNLISLISNAKTKISYYKSYSKSLYHFNVKRKKSTNSRAGLAIVNRLQLLEPLNIKFDEELKPKIYLLKEEKEKTELFLKSKGIDLSKPLFMISVLGSGVNKTYPLSFMAKVIDQLVNNTSESQILFNYIPQQEKEAKSVYDLCTDSTKKNIFFDVFGKSLRDFLSITSYCNALIGNEGGAVNMAKALEIKTFTIFSPWIDKATWSLFEDENNMSVHLKEYKPELYIKPEKEYKKEALKLYKEFKPDFFSDKLELFLNKI